MRVPIVCVDADLQAPYRFEAIRVLLARLVQMGAIQRETLPELFAALSDRENTMSTGIGFRLAIPHTTSALVREPMVAFGRSRTGIDFDALDNLPVEFVFLLLQPEQPMKREEHIQLLACIARALTNRKYQEILRSTEDPKEIAKILEDAFSVGPTTDRLLLIDAGADPSNTLHRRSPMKIEGIKGCYEKTSGLFYFARMCSKSRLHAEGKLPEDYFSMLGQGFDGRTCRYLGVTYDFVRELVTSGKSDEEVLEACFAKGRRLIDEEVLIYNSFMSKRGWRDDETAEFIPQLLREYGFPDDGSVVTDFDIIEMDEGRWHQDMWKKAWAPES